jgi:hypothetical protein
MKKLFELIKQNKTALVIIGSLIILTALLIVVSTMVLGNAERPIRIEYDEKTFKIIAPYETREVPYDSVEMYEYKATPPGNIGQAIDAQVSNKILSGIFQNDGYDPYYLHIYTKTGAYIFCYYKGQSVIFNLSSEEETSECYKELRNRIFGDTPVPTQAPVITLTPTSTPEEAKK